MGNLDEERRKQIEYQEIPVWIVVVIIVNKEVVVMVLHLPFFLAGLHKLYAYTSITKYQIHDLGAYTSTQRMLTLNYRFAQTQQAY